MKEAIESEKERLRKVLYGSLYREDVEATIEAIMQIKIHAKTKGPKDESLQAALQKAALQIRNSFLRKYPEERAALDAWAFQGFIRSITGEKI